MPDRKKRGRPRGSIGKKSVSTSDSAKKRKVNASKRRYREGKIRTGGGAGKARFNVATPTLKARTRPFHVQHTYYRIIFKQNPFNIISREVQGCTSTDFRLK